MNRPPYILTDVFAEVVEQVRVALGLEKLFYQFGYLDELNETLKQRDENPSAAEELKFPMIWLSQPFNVDHDANKTHLYGSTVVRVFIMNKSNQTDKASKRVTDNFKPVLIPIYVELLEQLNNHIAISYEMGGRPHTHTERYWWDEQQEVFQSVVDIIDIQDLEISINNNENC
jgi:hypothetical protein